MPEPELTRDALTTFIREAFHNANKAVKLISFDDENETITVHADDGDYEAEIMSDDDGYLYFYRDDLPADNMIASVTVSY